MKEKRTLQNVMGLLGIWASCLNSIHECCSHMNNGGRYMVRFVLVRSQQSIETLSKSSKSDRVVD
jgi:hypothetical protein